ncbi:MAG TPA: MOSC domain-containing protein [Thermoanaerobaculia bacterium]|nr:MOSC domain-containing protein [Thermoanaerobaculia bacterium]
MTGEVASIWIKRAHRGVMDPVDEVQAVTGRGLAGNADQGRRRQVTIIDEAAWRDATAETGAEVDPSMRRANVMVLGIALADSRGRLLHLGTCVIRILGETRPCERMEEAQAGLQQALRGQWRGGVFGEVVEGGQLRVGDLAELV